MTVPVFKSFRSTATPPVTAPLPPEMKLLADPVSGAPLGLQSMNGSGPDGIWTPVDLTAAQIATPTSGMLADLNAVYRLNVAPYTRYVSNGTALVPADVATYLASLPDSDAGLSTGDLFWNGGFLCKKV